MNKVKFIALALIFLSCVGSPVHRTRTYKKLQKEISINNENIMKLKIAMSKEQVLQIMGKPERTEGYQWGSAWLYRTAMTSGIYGTSDSDFTPIIFDENDNLIGWGRNFFTEQIKRYDIKIKHE